MISRMLLPHHSLSSLEHRHSYAVQTEFLVRSFTPNDVSLHGLSFQAKTPIISATLIGVFTRTERTPNETSITYETFVHNYNHIMPLWFTSKNFVWKPFPFIHLFPLPCPSCLSHLLFVATGFHLYFFCHRWRWQCTFNPIRTQQSIQRGNKSIKTISNLPSVQPKSTPLDSFPHRCTQMLWYCIAQPKTLIAPPC